MVKIFMWLLIIGLLPLNLCHATPPHTGVEGTAFIYGLRSPRPNAPPPPMIPLSATLTIVSLDDEKVIGQVTCDSDGYFKVSLKRGTYLLTPEILDTAGFHLRSDPIVVTVKKKSITNLTVEYHWW
jgi:hypothetical protein